MTDFSFLPLHKVWNSSFDCMILTGKQGEIHSLNRSAARLFSSSPSNIIGTSIHEMFPSEELKKSFQFKKDKTGITLSLGTRQLIVNTSVIQIDSETVYYLLNLKDNTQIQQLQYQLQQMNETRHLYEVILDQLEEGITAINQQGKIIFYNRKMGEIDTIEPASVRNKRILDIWPIEENSSTLLTALNTGKTLSHRENHFTTNGKSVTTLSKTVPLFLGNKKVGALEIATDITKQKQLTETIFQLQKQTKGSSAPSDSMLARKNNTRFQFDNIIFSSKQLRQTVEQARRAARSNSNVLIFGETGTGKELFAQSIHNESPRKNKPFIAQNCAALPESLLEGLLFGTSVGSFTGATDRAGLFEEAHGGTLLLDEINSMGTNLQAKLLRVLQERKLQRLGSSKVLDIDVRVITTINEDPLEAIANGKLREDLYYRLAVVNIVIPPLRNRKEDIPTLIEYFINKHSTSLGVNVTEIDEDVYQFFMNYQWPGNVRQLEHSLEGALNLIYDESAISFEHLSPTFKNKMIQQVNQPSIQEHSILFKSLPEQIEHLERVMIEQAIHESQGNITKASEQLGIPRQNLNYKIKKYKITYLKGSFR
ncbi:sigma 54-interacting transcriptional regulator [Bacillus rhizoplanae]|uniref:sigma-54 interaction domain-containing protein n=1 Tax=Bacillus rhizoplanae TaxID=2880966 RepID=UPI003D260FA1